VVLAECSHLIKLHLHDKITWYEMLEKKCRYNETTTVSITEVLEIIDACNEKIEEATEEIGRLTEQYSKLPLSGSFSGLLVKLFETRLKSIRNKSGQESVKRIEESLDRLKNKLSLLEEAARNKVRHPTIGN
jgi:hypothetical protein